MSLPKLVAVLGSATPPGKQHAALAAAMERVEGRTFTTELVDLGTVAITPAGGPPQGDRDDTADVVAKLAAADAVLLATPVYRGSLSGVLKNLLDHVPVEALNGTPVGIVAQGASDHHYLGADRHLRDVLTFFGSPVPPVSAYLTTADFADGRPLDRGVDEIVAVVDGLARLFAVTGGAPFGPPPLTERPRG
ncbi:NADPH-dependent FMN reductase [Patulibacter sp. NPDC049589]|uniref:NADPH-dependent FMN reductase n=1 Tax=Patulibacter sp. NPDC049589 TaxID=3154731 RepID=UPI0034302E2A